MPFTIPLVFHKRPAIRYFILDFKAFPDSELALDSRISLDFKLALRPVCYKRLVKRLALAQKPKPTPQKLVPELAFTNILVRQFIETCIKQTQDQAPTNGLTMQRAQP